MPNPTRNPKQGAGVIFTPQDTGRGAEGGEWASVVSGQQSEPQSEQVTEEPGFGPGAPDIKRGGEIKIHRHLATWAQGAMGI